MKLFLYVKILVLIFINSLLFAASLGGTVIIDNNDHVFNFNGKTLIIADAGNIFGSVRVTSTGSFVFPKTVSDNKNHAYSLKLTQLPDNNGYVCTINQASGTVFIHDKTDLVVSCKGKYYISVNVRGLSNGDTYTLADGNEILSFNTNSTQSFIQWYYANITYSFKPTFNYSTSDYKRCSNNTNGTITNNLTINIVCNTATFNQVDYPPNARYSSVSWKDGFGNVYVFGGDYDNYLNDLWRFNGTSWYQVIANGTTGSPSGRIGAVAWTDNVGNAYVFGGYNGNSLNDLWRFNGTSWSQVSNVIGNTPPNARYGAVAWKDNTGNAYVFGGYNGNFLNDLWIFNGTSWSPINNAGTRPSVRSGAVAWTDNAGNAYVFGGYNGDFLNDLWRFNGTNWSQVNNVIGNTPPNARDGAVAWTDNAGNAYVFGGNNRTSYYNDLWRFNGTSWSEVITNGATGSPSGRYRAVAWKDNTGNAYIFAGYTFNIYPIYYNDLWRFNGTSWSQVNNVIGNTLPDARYGAVAWTDNVGNAYVFGGFNGSIYLNDLWRFNGNSWSQLIANGAVGSPSGRYRAVAWTDNAGNAYVFGGYDGSYLNDLWKFNGTSWSPLTNAGTSPSVRSGAVAWADNVGNTYVFGGSNGIINYNDLWKFNGTSWSPLTNAGTSPSVRSGAVAWADNVGNAYVFGGSNGIINYNDLWKFDGTHWFEVNNQIGSTPSVRSGAVAWTDNAGNAYMFGGYYGSTYYNDLWKFNGRWTLVTTGIDTPPDTRYGAVSWKDNNGNAYVFSGYNSTISYLNDLYVI